MHAITSRWNRMSLKRQLWAVCLLLLVAGLVGIGFSQMTVAATRTAFSTVAETTAPAGNLLVNTDRDAYQAQLATSRLATLAGTEGEARDQQLALLEENADQTLSRFESYQEIALGTPEEVAIWDAYLADREVWLTAVDAVIAAPDVPTAEAAYLGADAQFEVMRTHLDVIQEQVYEPAIASLIDVQAADRTASMQQLVAIIAAISLVGLLAAWRFGSAVSGRVDRDSRSVRDATTNLVSVSDSLASSAEETSAMATETAGRADELTGHMQSLAAAVEEMGVSIAEIGRSTTEVSGISTDSVGLVDQALARVSVLTDSSEQIGRVAEVVTAIAEQTNLLALNATIEAARAGDAGRGFAVVASEVKDLATETATATGEIRALISRIQEDSDEVRQAITGIHGTIEKVNDLQTSVASAVEEQSITTAEIGRTVSYVSDQTSAMTGSIRTVADNATQATRNAETTRRATDSLRTVSSSLGRLVQGGRGLDRTSPASSDAVDAPDHDVDDRPTRAEIARSLAVTQTGS